MDGKYISYSKLSKSMVISFQLRRWLNLEAVSQRGEGTLSGAFRTAWIMPLVCALARRT